MNQKQLLSDYLKKLGSRGGKVSASKLTKKGRVERARKAGLARAAKTAKKKGKS